ncbi:MAG: hypothetical protein WAK29_07585 [Terriglobales bacterium]
MPKQRTGAKICGDSETQHCTGQRSEEAVPIDAEGIHFPTPLYVRQTATGYGRGDWMDMFCDSHPCGCVHSGLPF